uniref:leucine-rich repeat protein n=1 Tax=Adlercreutzia caecimuris TaxID=671266 RepID=UPI002729D7AA
MGVEKGSAAARPQGGSGLRAIVAAVFAMIALVGAVLCTPGEAMADEGIYAIFYENPQSSTAGETYTLVIQNGTALDPSYPAPKETGQVVRICSAAAPGEEGEQAGCSCATWRCDIRASRGSFPIMTIHGIHHSQYADATTRAIVKPGVAPHSLTGWFYGFERLQTVDLAGLVFHRAIAADGAFCGCASLNRVKLSPSNGSKISSMIYTFARCRSLEALDLSKMDTSSMRAGDMGGTFEGCTSLKRIDISGFSIRHSSLTHGLFLGLDSLEEVSLPGSGDFSQAALVEWRGDHPLKWRNEQGQLFDAWAIPARVAGTYRAVPVNDPLSSTLSLASAKVTVSARTWTGKAQKPAVAVKVGGKKLKEGRDY